MKITWILDNINTMNGMVRVVIGLSNYFTETGNNVEIISFYSQNATPFFHLNPDVKVRNMGKDWQKLSRFDKHHLLSEIMQSSDADIMLTCNEWANSSGALNNRKFKGKLIVTQHLTCDSFTRRRRFLNGLVHRFADKVVVLTEADRSFYEKRGLRNVIRIPNAVYTENRDLSTKESIILAIGRVEKAKGFDMLIEAFSRIAEEIPDWKLKILGDGSQRMRLLDEIKAMGLSQQIEMPGMSQSVAVELARSSIYVLSSRYEGLPLTMLEAMSAANAIVAFEIPSVKDVLTAESAIIVPPEDVDALACALRRMVVDKNLRNRASVSAYDASQKYSIENIGKQWLHLFDCLLNSGNK